MLVRILTIGLITSLGAAGTASAHHSQAQFNLDPAAMAMARLAEEYFGTQGAWRPTAS